MSTKRSVPEVPYKVPLLNEQGFLNSAWSKWFRELYLRIGGTLALNNVQLEGDVSDINTTIDTLQADLAAHEAAAGIHIDWRAPSAGTIDPSNYAGGDAAAIHDNVNAEISVLTAKTTPVGADVFIIEDSAASFAKKKLLMSDVLTATAYDENKILTNNTGQVLVNYLGNVLRRA